MRIVFRNLVLSFLPALLGIGAGFGFASMQQRCGRLVGPLLAAKCGRIQRDYQLQLQTGGMVAGGVIAATIGIWLDRRRTRREQIPPA